ncbi:MAG TPA: metallophosphoesterase [Ktedonobacteraceae bacterium]|nr:metallophosphoesterase [Ktedonobacteraceae bacterium]
MKVYAISDLHVGHVLNREALAGLSAYPDDWLIVAGDVGETLEHLRYAWEILTRRFARVIWVPGNHELWTLPAQSAQEEVVYGEEKYRQLVALCREYGVVTPEDPYIVWPGAERPTMIVPMFLLYDYTFHPSYVTDEGAVAWAAESKVVCADEYLLYPHPYSSRQAWCQERCAITERRLQQIPAEYSLILVTHFPLLQELAYLPAIPRFSIWCGTRITADWHRRFAVSTVIYGHIHIPSTKQIDGVRFEEVSLGYPRQWPVEQGIDIRLREILLSQ